MPFRTHPIRWMTALAAIGCAVVWGVVASLPAGRAASAPEDSSAERARQLDDLTELQKKELREKQERFENLSPKEKDRVRCLHKDLARHPDGARLTRVASRYAEWLKTLSPGVRAELLELPLDQRLERIRKFKEEQQAQRVRDVVATRFTSEDVRAVFKWLGAYAAKHEEELLSSLGSEAQQFLRRMPPGPGRHVALMRFLQMRPAGQPLPQPTAAEFDDLRTSLSDEARAEFDKIAEDEQRLRLVLDWVRAAMTHRMMPPQVSREELAKFYAQLEQKDRDWLEQLPQDRLQVELRKLYWRQKFSEHGGGFRGPFRRHGDGRPPHFQGGPRGPRPENPRGNGPRPEGDRPGERRQPPFGPGGRPEENRPPPPAAEEQPGF